MKLCLIFFISCIVLAVVLLAHDVNGDKGRWPSFLRRSGSAKKQVSNRGASPPRSGSRSVSYGGAAKAPWTPQQCYGKCTKTGHHRHCNRCCGGLMSKNGFAMQIVGGCGIVNEKLACQCLMGGVSF